jgi:hypothetical protein
MGVADRLRTDDVAGGGTPAPLVAGKSRSYDPLRANEGTGDVRGGGTNLTQVITLNSFAGTDSFKVRCYSFPKTADVAAGAAKGAVVVTDTAAFVRGTNAAASDLQTALRTATGDTTLTVSGTTDAGPFTVTFVGKSKHRQPLFALVTLSGCSGNVTRGTLTYSDAGDTLTGTPGTTPSTGGIAFDQESSKGFTKTVPLGHSIVTDGTGQTAQTELAPPTMVSAVGGAGQVVVDTTEVSSGGTSAEVLFTIVNTSTGKTVFQDSQDADGDATITTVDSGSAITAGNYFLLCHTVTANGRISRTTAPEYFTVT